MLRLLVVWLINAVALLAVAYVMPGIEVASGLWVGMFGTIVYSLISWASSSLVFEEKKI